MTEDIKKYFNGLIQKVSGIMCIIVTDRDGTPVISAKADDAALEIGLATKPTFLATYTMATDQAGKLGLGKNQSIVCMYSNYQIIQMNKLPLIVTFIGSEDCNTGHILALSDQIDNYLDEIKQTVIEA
ncbi:ragulator complex protein LAMTOR3 homolog [Contarinia nasturtii]|uniref:ragulator complex protein LAMTOR3 homolog n=1 Tax=Contarinia nasturtii TaxID=265458 RepID=UPI0012D3C691|nr:ragulator complex protein LAMTOR3 homolog [Contarinia nasturtii]